jgi:uncharacterized protein YjbI with pentapeptide repeats
MISFALVVRLRDISYAGFLLTSICNRLDLHRLDLHRLDLHHLNLHRLDLYRLDLHHLDKHHLVLCSICCVEWEATWP